MRAVLLATLVFFVPLAAGLDHRLAASSSRHPIGRAGAASSGHTPRCAVTHENHAGELAPVAELRNPACAPRRRVMRPSRVAAEGPTAAPRARGVASVLVIRGRERPSAT